MNARIEVTTTRDDGGQVYFRAKLYVELRPSPRSTACVVGQWMRSVDGALGALVRELRPEDLRPLVEEYGEDLSQEEPQ